MHAVYHSALNLKVNRISAQDLLAECSLLSTDREAHSWMICDIKTLKIRQAGWALHRSPEGSTVACELPELAGMPAYLNSGPWLKEVLNNESQILARELLSECIRGLVQAETFFYSERGFTNALQYDAFWDEIYLNSCHYYSHLGQIEKPWMEYVGEAQRRGNLFNRCHSIAIYQESNSHYTINAVFIDSFHELSLRMIMDKAGIVRQAAADYVRAPDKICWDNALHLEKFLGQDLPSMSKKDAASLAGGPQGCNHLVDLLYDSCQAARTVIQS